ncbi:hypothetical protein CR513_58636, partial [Mucuna pruriens]
MIQTKKYQESYPRDTEVRKMLQSLMDKGLIQVERKDDEVVVVHQEGKLPTPFPYKSSKLVPWRYDVEVKTESSSITNIVGIRGITRSGRIYAPESLRRENPVETSANFGNKENSKGKEPEVHVDKNISLDKFGAIINNIMVNNYLAFSNKEISIKGRGHNKALNISVKCLGHLLTRVLINNGSSLNVMLKATLEKLSYGKTNIKSNAIIVRAFDGSKREVMEELQIPVQIGPFVFQISFQIMDIKPVHASGVVPSSLYQKLKFLVDNKLVIIFGEDLSVSFPQSTKHIEVAEEALETAF